MPGPLTIFALIFLSISLLSFGVSIMGFRKRIFWGGAIGLLVGFLFLTLTGLFVMISVAIQGYRALTQEEVAARVKIEPTGPETFVAYFSFPNGHKETFSLAGDQFYVDAHILKWKPVVNFLGLHTAYELDRVAGRYTRLEDERSKPRTVFLLSKSKPIDMFSLRERYSLLSPLLDAEYGSATFIPSKESMEVEVRVSTTGLLVRRDNLGR
jgi:hypothetical protein